MAFSDVALPAPPTPAHLVWVDDVAALSALADTLEDQDMFALDVEHHSEHSYLGFTCLLQISAGQSSFTTSAGILPCHGDRGRLYANAG